MKRLEKLEWNVFRYDCNSRRIKVYNIFNHGSFIEDLKKHRKECQTRDAIAELLDRFLRYYFWSKSEMEIAVGPMDGFDDECSLKVDVYQQVKINWEVFVDYVWSAMQKG